MITLTRELSFKRSLPCNDIAFVIRVFTEKSVDYINPTFSCFSKLQKAADPFRLNKVTIKHYVDKRENVGSEVSEPFQMSEKSKEKPYS